MATEEELKKRLAKAEKSLADTKAAYTKGQQALAATKAELTVLEEAGVRIPAEIADLKVNDPEKYAGELEKFNRKLVDTRKAKADKALEDYMESAMADAAKAANLTVKDIQDNVPPNVFNAYKDGKLSAHNVAKLALQYKDGKVPVKSPTTQTEFDFSSVAGGLLEEASPEADETLNEKDYII